MYYTLSVILGLLGTVMVTMNGKLGSHYGTYSAAAIIHILGMLTISAIVLFKRERFTKKQPFWLYLGGAVGFFTVIFNNMAFGQISVSAILALGLLGQSLASLVFDQFGLLHMPKHPFNFKKLFGIALVMLGIVPMILVSRINSAIYIIFPLFSGIIFVLARTLNARLAQQTNSMQSTFFNYFSGLILALIALFFAGGNEPMLKSFSLSPQVWIYLGGILGVGYVFVLNVAVNKVSSFYLTLLMFIGQVFSGIGVDMLLTGAFSVLNLIGGVLVSAGLIQNLMIEKRRQTARSSELPVVSDELTPLRADDR